MASPDFQSRVRALTARGNRDTVLSLRPYDGPLFPAGAQIATFARNTTGMTIENGHQYELVGRVGVA